MKKIKQKLKTNYLLPILKDNNSDLKNQVITLLNAVVNFDSKNGNIISLYSQYQQINSQRAEQIFGNQGRWPKLGTKLTSYIRGNSNIQAAKSDAQALLNSIN
jgi:hypothetical protein